MFGQRSFEERKGAIEQGNCTCFPDNKEGPNCLKNCKHRREVVQKIEAERDLADNNSNEE